MSLLLHPFIINLHNGKGRLTSEQQALYQEAEKEFSSNLGDSVTGKELVKAVFHLSDQLIAGYQRTHALSCRPGCSACCYQMVCCTTLEMQLIIDYLDSKPKKLRRQINQKATKRAAAFYRIYQRNELGVGQANRWEEIGDTLRLLHKGKSCPFLDHESRKCYIYPVRPIDCRNARSSDSFCGKKSSEKPTELKFFFDQISCDAIAKEEQRLFADTKIVPLVGWIISQEFSAHFFK